MTTAYCDAAGQHRVVPLFNHQKTPNTASAQGPEAAKVSSIVGRAFSQSTADRGQSPESERIREIGWKLRRELVEPVENLRAPMANIEDFSYNHIPLKPVFSVRATYKHIGKLKPREFPLAE